MQKSQQHPVRWLHCPRAACLLPTEKHHPTTSTPTPCLHRQTRSYSPARPFGSTLGQRSQNIPGHVLLKLSLKHGPNLHLSPMDEQHPSSHPWQHWTQDPSSSEHPSGCHVPHGATTLQAKRQGCAASRLGETPGISLPCLSFSASPAAALHPAELMKCSEIHRHHLFVRIKPAPLNVALPSACESRHPFPRAPQSLQAPICPPDSEGPRGVTLGTSAQADWQCWLRQAQMPLLVSMSPAQPISLQAGLKSGPRPGQVTPPVTQPAPVKLSVLPPPVLLLHTGMLSEHHLGMRLHPDLIPKPPAPCQGWKVLGKARGEEVFFLPMRV